MSAWVSPPQLSTSHIVEVAASMAHAASTALPPRWNIIAPAVAASGLPVIAIHFWPCSGGFCVLATERDSAGAMAWPRAGGVAVVMQRRALNATTTAFGRLRACTLEFQSMRCRKYAAGVPASPASTPGGFAAVV